MLNIKKPKHMHNVTFKKIRKEIKELMNISKNKYKNRYYEGLKLEIIKKG
jgi:hypothetical protein